MAKRYCGNLKIRITYCDGNMEYPSGYYRCSVTGRGGKWSGIVGPAASGFGRGIAYDSPVAYDTVARSAVSFATDAVNDLTDDAELAADGADWEIERDPFTLKAPDDTRIRVYYLDTTADCWTAVLRSPAWDASATRGYRAMLGMSNSPNHPQGISQFSSGQEGAHLGRLTQWRHVPSHIREHILARVLDTPNSVETSSGQEG